MTILKKQFLTYAALFCTVTSFAQWGLNGNSSIASSNFIGTTSTGGFKDLVIKTNSVERMRILSTGNMGIGTTAPSALLHIQSSSNNPLLIQGPAGAMGIRLNNTASGGRDWAIWSNHSSSGTGSTGDLIFYDYSAGGGKRMTLNASGVTIAGDLTFEQTLGTNDSRSLRLKVNGDPAGIIDINGAAFFGYMAGTSTDIDTAFDNSGFGGYAMLYNTTGDYNSAFGRFSLTSNTIGNFNTAVGWAAGYGNTEGSGNTAIGTETLNRNSIGGFNIGVGYQSLYYHQNGDYNVGIGSQALYNDITGSLNIAVGEIALFSNEDGQNNTAIGGTQALSSNTTGSNNVALGSGALSSNITGNNNTAIGTDAFTSMGTNYSNSIALGYGVPITASNQIRIGNIEATTVGSTVSWSTISDGRFKKEIKENVPGLDFITKLRPVTYYLDKNKVADFINIPDKLRSKDDNSGQEPLLQTGLIAQEVEKTAVELGYEFSGVDKPKNSKDYYGLRYAEFTIPLIKAVQEQQKMIEEKSKKMDEMQQQLDNLKNIIKNISTSSTTTSDPNTEKASLEQNIPNPFSESAIIKYYLPANSGNAVVSIKNMEGKELTNYSLTKKGSGQLEITSGTLQSGTYIYSLIVEGKVLDSKKLVVVE